MLLLRHQAPPAQLQITPESALLAFFGVKAEVPQPSRFLIDPATLFNTPSRRDGIDELVEFDLRRYGCELIAQAGVLLRLPQAAVVTAHILFHRFYYRKSFRRHDVNDMAMATLFLAGKLEECAKPARHFITVFHRILARRAADKHGNANSSAAHNGRAHAPQAGVVTISDNAGAADAPQLPSVDDPIELESSDYWARKDALIKKEGYVLKELGFVTDTEQPHRFLLGALKLLDPPTEFVQQCWNFCNDAMWTAACVQYA
jgi:hypothetical protein